MARRSLRALSGRVVSWCFACHLRFARRFPTRVGVDHQRLLRRDTPAFRISSPFFAPKKPSFGLERHLRRTSSICVKPLRSKASTLARQQPRDIGVVFPHVVVANSRLVALFSGNYVCTARTDVRHSFAWDQSKVLKHQLCPTALHGTRVSALHQLRPT